MDKAKKTLVVATAPGFHQVVREPGDPAFEIIGPVPKWCKAVESKKQEVAHQKENAPTDYGYKAKHGGAGNWLVVDKAGNPASPVYKRDATDTPKAKADAEAEADRLNAGGQPAPAEPVNPPGITEPQDDPEQGDDNLPDA